MRKEDKVVMEMQVKVGDQIRCFVPNVGPWSVPVVDVHSKRVTVEFGYYNPETPTGKPEIRTRFVFEREDRCSECGLWDAFFPGHETHGHAVER